MIIGMMGAESGMKYSRNDIRESIQRVDPDGLLMRSEAFKKRLIRYKFLQVSNKKLFFFPLLLIIYKKSILLIIFRRVYNVPGPNHLWHMDGHHKLIRYGLVTHGCIDGNSRVVIYLGI